MVVSSLMTKLRKDEDEKNKEVSVEECTKCPLVNPTFGPWKKIMLAKNRVKQV